MSRDNDQKKEVFPYKEVSRDTDACKSSDLKFSNHCSTFILKNQLASFSYQHSISFTHGLQHYKTLNKLACTDYVDFGKSQDRFGRFFWSKNDSNYLVIKLKVFKGEDKNAEFCLRQNFSMGEADFIQFIRQRNQLVVATDNFLREKNLSPVLQSTLSKDMEEQLELLSKLIDIVHRPNKRICVTLLRYKADNPDTSFAQVRLFGRKTEEEKFQQFVYVNYKLDEFVYLLDVMNSESDNVIANQPICKIL